ENENTKEVENIEENLNGSEVEQKMNIVDASAYKMDVLHLLKVKLTAQKKVNVVDITKYKDEHYEEKTLTKTKEIPDSLINMLAEHVIENGEVTLIESMLTRNEISCAEYEKYTNVEFGEMDGARSIIVDGDNDGIADLFSLTFTGFSGDCELEFRKGNGDGTYTKTHMYWGCLRAPFGVLNYDNVNYILLEDIDYKTSNYGGYHVFLYDNGEMVDAKSILIETVDYKMDILQEESSFAEIEEVKNTLCKKEYPSILENSYYYSIIGTAEQLKKEGEDAYSCDIDNDGQVEYYHKSMSWPSKLSLDMHCTYEFEDSTIVADISNSLQEDGEGELYTFWFNQVGNQNVLYMYYEKDWDYTLYAFLIQKKEVFGEEKKIVKRMEQLQELELMKIDEVKKLKTIDEIMAIPKEVFNEMGEKELCGIILNPIGAGTFRSLDKWAQRFREVYSFDMEVLCHEKMYTLFLEGISEIASWSEGIIITEIGEETIFVDCETNKEIQRICFKCNGKQYQYEAVINDDCFDTGIIDYLNEIIKERDTEKQFWVTSDGYQTYLIFFNTKEWAEKFEEYMGYSLEE
uniref:hypothetical protein n=1 Tax=Anaerosporobacter sp. TaxID=1872529 RepID=UPI00286F6545